MRLFLSCVSNEFRSYRLKLANQLGALRDYPCEVKVQEDFQQGGFTLLDQLADYIRECDLVIHLAGDACGAQPTPEHVTALYKSLGDAPPDPLPRWSYTQWEYRLAQRFERKMLVYLAAADTPRDCALPVPQTGEAAGIQQAHVKAVRQSGKQYTAFANYNSLVREVFHDLGLEPGRKINNLPYKSLGSLFKGRDDFLLTLHQTLGSVEYDGFERSPTITAAATAVAIHGLGGSGKSRTAIEYAQRYIDEYTALLFVRADSDAGLQQNLAALCGPAVLNLPAQAGPEIKAQVDAVLLWLQQHAGWLLICDNADSDDAAQAVQDLLGRLTPSGQVLVTSRLSNWPGGVASLSLDILPEADAVAFLLERTEARRRKTLDEADQAGVVATELGQLPLALEQAGAYIDKYRFSFADYLAEWYQQRDKVLAWFDPRLMQYSMSVAVTWQTSFDSLSEPARQLLRTLAWLAPDPIPESLLQAGGGPFPVEKSGPAQAEPDPRDALADLDAHSLVTRADQTASFTVHRLVQDVTRRSIPGDGGQIYLKRALRWIDVAFVGNPEDVDAWPVLVPLAPHALTVVGAADAEHIADPTGRLMSELGLLYLQKTQYAQAEPLLRRVPEIFQEIYGPASPNFAKAQGNLGQLLKAINRPSDAEPLLRQALALNEQAYGPNHPDVAVALNNLALFLKENNRRKDAEPLYRRALEIDQQAHGPCHADVARDLNNLAQLFHGTNRHKRAESMMRRALAIDEQVYGADHPEVARDLNNLARWLQDTDRPDEAGPMMGRVVKIFQKAYGPNHPKIALGLNNQAGLLQTRQPEEAERLMRQALAIDEHAYGPDHPEVARDLYNLGRLLKDVNRLNDAEPLLRRVVQIYVKFTRDTGNPHQRLQQAINSYGNLLTQMGRPQDQVPAQLSQVTGFSFGS